MSRDHDKAKKRMRSRRRLKRMKARLKRERQAATHVKTS
jgi:hypothetical protein